MGKTRTDTLRVDNPTLEDLRWLVRETEGAPDDTSVTLRVSAGDRPFDSGTSSIEIEVQR